jgi:hypothetical protein
LSNGNERPDRDERHRKKQAGESAAVGKCEEHTKTHLAKFHGETV